MTDPVNPDFRASLAKAHKTAVRFGGAMIAALILDLGLVEVLRAAARPFSGFAGVRPGLGVRYPFYAAAAALVLGLRLLNGILLRKGRSEDGPAALRRLSRAGILTLVLAEGPALLGLALFLVGGYNRDFYVLLFVSLVLMFMYFPRIAAWEAYLRNRPTACGF
jgi:hypothetical protein